MVDISKVFEGDLLVMEMEAERRMREEMTKKREELLTSVRDSQHKVDEANKSNRIRGDDSRAVH